MPEPAWSFVEVRGSDGRGAPGSHRDRGVLGRLRSVVGPPERPDSSVVSRLFVVGTFATGVVAERLVTVLRRRGRETRAVDSTGTDDPPSRPGRTAPIEAVTVDGTGSQTPLADASDRYGRPDVLVVTAIGRGDLGAMGPGRGDVVRSIAAAVPAGAHVVNAEGAPAVAGYLETAVERRGASITHVGGHDAAAPGAELAGAVDAALAALDEPPLSESERGTLVAASRPDWIEFPEGRLFDALGVTDVVAVERLRRALAGGATEGDAVELVAVLGRDRRALAAATADYAERSHERGVVSRLHAVGPLAGLVERRCDVPCVTHEPGVTADAVLETALSNGPTIVVGSQECPIGADLEGVIQQRIERSGTPRIG